MPYCLPVRRVLLLVAFVGLAVPGTSAAAGGQLVATVGPGFEISLTDADGKRVTQLEPGAYEITVHDRSDHHNFHLSGPGGFDMRTEVAFEGTTTWRVNLVAGSWSYVCDPHRGSMRGSFVVGSQPPPPPPAQKLFATVGPGAAISIRTASGARARAVGAGTYTIVVRDRSATQNFHLAGPGVNRKTGVRFRGTVTWKVKLGPGKNYRFFSDASAKLKGVLRVRS